MKIIMLGPQASGKGTQAAMLADHLNIVHISTGDALRQNIRENTNLGQTAKEFMNAGKLVPDQLINEILKDRISKRDCEPGFILDGYPRNISQARFLDTVTQVDKAIEIQVSDREAIKRISGRRTCNKCGAIFSIFQASEEELSGACNKCGGKLAIRDDDTEDAVRKRLEIYHHETEPLVGFYKEKGILLRINGERKIEKIFDEIKKKI